MTYRRERKQTIPAASDSINGPVAEELPASAPSADCQIILETTRQLIALCDLRGKITYANQSFRSLLNKSDSDICGQTMREIFPPSEAGKLMELITAAGHKKTTGECTLEVRRDDGGTQYFQTHVEPHQDSQGRLKFITCCAFDITSGVQTERRMEVERRTYRHLFYSSYDSLMIIRGPSWKFTSANAATCRTFRAKSEAEFLAYPPWEVSPRHQPDGRLSTEKAREMIDHALREGSHSFEWVHRRLDGEEFHATVLLTRTEIGGDTLVQATVRDISEQKKTEAALLASEKRFRELAELLPETVFETDESGVLSFTNKLSYQLFGYDEDELASNMNVQKFIAPVDRARAVANFFRVMMGENMTPEEYLMMRKDGTTFPATIHATANWRDSAPGGIRGILVDITKRKEAEALQRENDQRLRKLSKHIPGMIYQFMRRADGTYCVPFTSDAIERVFGVTAAEVQDNFASITKIIHPDDLDKVMASIEASAKNMTAWQCEYRVIREEGVCWVFGQSTPEYDTRDGSIIWHGHNYDITDRKRQEAEHRRIQEQGVQSKKMAAIGLLAGGVAHDFNNQLAVILGNLDLAQDGLDPFSSLATDLMEIRGAALKAAELTKSLLAFSRKQPLKVMPNNINTIVQDFMASLGRLLKENIVVRHNLSHDLCEALVDSNQVSIIIANVVANAGHAMPNGGTLTLETRNVTLGDDDLQRFEDARPGSFVMLSITDTGTGISPEHLTQIFEPFFTTKEKGKGTGLGLATTHGSVIQQGGFIDVKSEVGQGTTFYLYFPATQEKAQTHTAPFHKETLVRGTETILVVDDEEGVRTVMGRNLERLGYKVLQADGAGTAYMILSRMNKAGKLPDLVLTDICMKDFSGTELAKDLKELYPDLPVIYMSGYPAEENNLTDFLQKPVAITDLSTKLRSVLDRK